ncbi:MAG: M56 family metallopeptidase, partial [Planctomycetota bacterium]
MNQLQSFSAFLDSFGSIPSSLIHATLMLSVACALTWMLVRGVSLRSARLRQFVFLCVLLQGVMLFRLPIELPVYTETESGQAFDSPIGQPADWTEPSRLSQLQNQADATIDNEVVSDASAVTGVFEASLLQDSTSGIVTAQLVLLVWAIGASLILFFALSRYLLLCRLVGRLPRASEPWQTHWNDICRRGGVFAPRMVIGQTLGPMLVRRIRGYVLVVPSQYWQSLTLEERESVLLHECAHLKRRDVYRQAFVRAIALLHWFNPSAWWAVRRYEESTEWACDEYMMRHSQTHAVGLATALVRLVEMGSEASDRHVGGFGVQAMAAPPLLDRVKRLLNQKPSEDRIMQRWCFLLLAAGLMIVSAFQFRLVE